MGTTKRSSQRTKSSKEKWVFSLPQLPSQLTQPLGLEGWVGLEPLLLAVLVTRDPLLLIGPHGSAKSFFLERLAQVIGLDYRFYNASLINFDDLVGIPIPDESRTRLTYITTESAIWDAQIVFVDEINRTRPELLNKLFPIIHEKRVQGIFLENLRYRWAAMNPPPIDDVTDENLDVYLGTEPLDPALADRFSMIVEVPSWQQLSDVEKQQILRDQFAGQHPFAVTPNELIQSAVDKFDSLKTDPPKAIADYLVYLLTLLDTKQITCSARRATFLHSNILAIQAARMALFQQAFPEMPYQAVDWETSALLALQNSLPHTAQGRKPDPVFLLASHRQAWAITSIDEDNPWRDLLPISNPLERCIAGIRMGNRLNGDDLSQLILDAVSSVEKHEFRLSVMLAVYLAVHNTRDLRAIVYDTLATDLRPILCSEKRAIRPKNVTEQKKRLKFSDLANELLNVQPLPLRNSYCAKLLNTLAVAQNAGNVQPREICKHFFKLWDQLFDNQTLGQDNSDENK